MTIPCYYRGSKPVKWHDQEDQNASALPRQRRSILCNWKSVCGAMIVMLLLLAMTMYDLWLQFDYNVHRHRTTLLSEDFRQCGNSSSEARSRGCVMDLISRAWLPRDCYDAELTAEFLNVSDWHWYADRNRTQELNREDIRQGGGPDPIFVSRQYHYVHCAYIWKKYQRAVLHGAPIEDYIGNYSHTEHCTRELVKEHRASNLTDSPFYLLYPYCPKS